MDTQAIQPLDYQIESAFVDLIGYIFTTYVVETYATCILLSSNTILTLLGSVMVSSTHPVILMTLGNLTKLRYDPRIVSRVNQGCHAFIVDQDSVFEFLDLFIVSHDYALYRNPNKTVIVVNDPNGVQDPDFLDQIRTHPVVQEIPRLLLLDPRDDAIDFWTHRYVSEPEEAEQLVLLDSYFVTNGSFLNNENLFPDKTLDLERRMFRLASFRLIPHFIYTPITDDSKPWIAKYQNRKVSVDGMGGLVMVEFCLKYNCTWDLKIDQAGEWGLIYDNWTGDGIIGTIAERRADAGVGSLLTWQSVYQYLGFTSTIRKVGITCFAPRPRMIPSWKTVALVFQPEVWICILVSFICCFGTYTLVEHYEPQTESYGLVWNALNVTAIILFQGAKILYRSVPESVLSICLLMFAINLGNIFVGKNASLRTFPLFELPTDTYEDVANKDLIWTQTHEAWVHSLFETKNPYLLKVLKNYRIYTVPELLKLANQGEVAFGVSKLNYGHYMIGTFITAQNVHLYRLMKEDLYFEYEVSMTTKTWPLRDRLADLILRIVASGIRAYQEPIVAKRYMDYGVQIKIFHSQDKEEVPPHPMDNEDLLAAYILLVGGVGLGALILMGELMAKRYAQWKKNKAVNSTFVFLK